MQGNPAAVQELRAWARKWQGEKRPERPGAVLVGEAGVGKTSAAFALAAELGWTPIELNASDARNASAIEMVVTRGATSQGFTGTGEYQQATSGQRKLFILDEADNVFGNEDRGGMQQIVATLRQTQQPVVLIANDGYALWRKGAALRDLCVEIKFKRVHAGTVAKVLARICKAESVAADIPALEALAERSGGDVRAAVGDLDALARSRRRLTLEDVDALGYRDPRATVFDALRTVLGGASFAAAKEAAASLDEDPESLLLWVEENAPREYAHAEDRARAMATLGRADEFLAATRRTQHYRFWAVASDLMTGGVAAAKRHRTTGWARYEFPAWLRKMSASRAARAVRNGLAAKVADEYHGGTRSAREHVLPMLSFVALRSDAFAVALVADLGLEPDELALLVNEKPSSAKVKKLVKAADEVRAKHVADELGPIVTRAARGKRVAKAGSKEKAADDPKKDSDDDEDEEARNSGEADEDAVLADEDDEPAAPSPKGDAPGPVKPQKRLFEF